MSDQLPDLPDSRYDAIAAKRAGQAAPIATRKPWRELWFWVAVVSSVFLVFFGIVEWTTSRQALHEARQANATRDSAIAAVDKLAQQVKSLGGTPVVQPSNVIGPQGPKGDTGPPPTADQIEAAVTTYCADHGGCGQLPTFAQVRAAVQSCTACRGPAGENGQNGRNGTNAPPLTDAQLEAAVATYCAAHGQCAGPPGESITGPEGPPGPSGANGQDGRGISSVDCSGFTPKQQLVIHYSDGSTQTVDCTQAPPQPTATGG